MRSQVICDTGPLVALLNRHDHAHTWVVQQLREIQPPMLTCESVLAEATYLTRAMHGAHAALIEMIGEGFLGIGMAVKNMNDIIDATRKGEAYDPSHVRGQGINVNTGDVVTRVDSQASRCGSPSRGSSSALETRPCLARRSQVRWAVPTTAVQRRAKALALLVVLAAATAQRSIPAVARATL